MVLLTRRRSPSFSTLKGVPKLIFAAADKNCIEMRFFTQTAANLFAISMQSSFFLPDFPLIFDPTSALR